MKWAWVEDRKFIETGSLVIDKVSTKTDYAKLAESGREADVVVVSCVAGKRYQTALNKWLKSSWSPTVHFLQSSASALGVTNAYTEPETLGVDRWAALVAVRKYGRGVCIIDAGSALTVDVMDKRGKHLGGLIMPGLSMMREALQQGTDAIEAQSGQPSVAMLATDTGSAVTVGTLYASISAVDRISAEVEQELGSDLVRIITGGNAMEIAPLLADKWQFNEHLVLEGLNQISGQLAR